MCITGADMLSEDIDTFFCTLCHWCQKVASTFNASKRVGIFDLDIDAFFTVENYCSICQRELNKIQDEMAARAEEEYEIEKEAASRAFNDNIMTQLSKLRTRCIAGICLSYGEKYTRCRYISKLIPCKIPELLKDIFGVDPPYE